jgi:uridine kinase
MTATPFVLSICGPAGSGKSQLAKALVDVLGAETASRVPTDYFALPAAVPLSAYFLQPVRYDWPLLTRWLNAPLGTEATTPDFDFESFQRRSKTGGRRFTIRPVIVVDAMEPYPYSQAIVLVTVPGEIRQQRITIRDEVWQSRVHERWSHLETTWEQVRLVMPAPDVELDGTVPVTTNARWIADWLDEVVPLFRGEGPDTEVAEGDVGAVDGGGGEPELA